MGWLKLQIKNYNQPVPEFTLSGKKDFLDTVLISPVRVNLVTDSDNDGKITSRDKFMEDSPLNSGKIVIPDTGNSDADQAVTKINGSCSVSNFRWISNGAGEFCIGFDFDNENGGRGTMRADADKCQAAGIGNLRLDGNGVSPSKDNKEWSF